MDSPVRNQSVPAVGAFFESFDGWAQLLKAHGASVAEGTTPAPVAADVIALAMAETPSPFPSPAAEIEALAWRPGRRPPMALLHVVDDGRDSGETIRLRDDTLVVGRQTGGVSIPHDPFIAVDHARLDRLPGGGWLLTDLGSKDGTWVRVMTAKLRSGTRFQIGGTRLVFRRGADGVAEFAPAGRDDGAAHSSCPNPFPSHPPIPCPPPPFLIGRADAYPGPAEPELPTLLLDDPFVSPIHAEVIAGRSAWRIVNRGLNGLWVRIEAPVRLDAAAQFQCGDQRFVLEPLACNP
jgi:pSer/pThr/pTyr-binding forkhead associated (FHA) protein